MNNLERQDREEEILNLMQQRKRRAPLVNTVELSITTAAPRQGETLTLSQVSVADTLSKIISASAALSRQASSIGTHISATQYDALFAAYERLGAVVRSLDPNQGTASTHSTSRAKRSKSSSRKRTQATNATRLDQACEQCGRRDTPEWRKGPSGKLTLCNACGLKYARQVRKRGKVDQLSGDVDVALPRSTRRIDALTSSGADIGDDNGATDDSDVPSRSSARSLDSENTRDAIGGLAKLARLGDLSAV